MNSVEYSEKFIKDLKKLKRMPEFEAIRELCFIKLPESACWSDLPNLKKMQGYDNYYRILKGDYRIGIKIENDNLTFMRVLHRKEVYKYFP